MHARNRTWLLGSDPVERCRQRTLPVEGGDGSTLSLDFTTGVLDPRLSFQRLSDATFINSSGRVQYADANHVRNSTMLVSTLWSQTTTGTGAVTINGDGSVRLNGAGGRATWLQSLTLASGLQTTFSVRVTAFTNTDLRASDLFFSGFGFTGQQYFYTDESGTTHSLTAFESLPKTGTNGLGVYSCTATTTGTLCNIIFGVDCNGVGRLGDVTIRDPQVQYGTVVPRQSYVPNSSTSSAKWDSARFDYDPTTLAPRGLLIEGQVPTLNAYSEDFSNAYWQKINTTIDATSVTCPDNIGRTTVRVVDNATNASHSIRRGIATTAGTTYTLSFFVRKGSTDTFAAQCFWSSSYQFALTVSSIDNNTHSITSASGVNAAATRVAYSAFGSSPWYRYSITFTHPSAVGAATPDFNFCPINNVSSYVGSGNHTDFFGIQLEAGSGASSYIPTGASQATRAADNCELLNLTTMGFNASAGTIYTDTGTRLSTGSQRNYTFLPASGGSDQMFEGSGIAFNVFSSGSFVAQIGTSNPLLSQKIAAAYAVNDYAVSVAGGAVVTDTAGALPTSLTKLTIGGSIINSATYMNGCIRSFKYWPTRLPNATLQSLTT